MNELFVILSVSCALTTPQSYFVKQGATKVETIDKRFQASGNFCGRKCVIQPSNQVFAWLKLLDVTHNSHQKQIKHCKCCFYWASDD